MSSARDEARALTRGALVLLAVSAIRYGEAVFDRVSSVDAADDHALLDSLAETTRAAIEEGERRSAPLAPGETLDPNTAGASDLDRLPGVGPATARAIVAARDSVAFRDVRDLLRVRGIGPGTLERFAERLRFAPSRSGRPDAARPRGRTPGGVRRPVDLNTADDGALQALPGVGPALAARIIREREDRPFESLDDLSRVRGIGPATLQRLRGLAFARRRP